MTISSLELRIEPYEEPVAQTLVSELQGEFVALYGGPDETPVAAGEFAPPLGLFLLAYLDGQPVGCGGVRGLDSGAPEIKRMYVRSAWRRRGIARRLLAGLEAQVAMRGARKVLLMTGPAQPGAIHLYESSGYRPAGAYGVYRCAPGARFFEKQLTAQGAARPGC